MRRRWIRARRWLRRGALAGSVITLGLALWVVALPFPRAALAPEALTSTVIVDRHGHPLREVLSARQGRGRWVSLEAISPHLVAATVHAEDKRFYAHAGVDGIALLRSIAIDLAAGELLTGASTLTQQTVKMTVQRGAPRSLGTKLMEVVWAWRLELLCTKGEILTQYLNRAPYGNQLFGAEAAAWMYFGKPASDLSLAEAALLAGIPQAPSRQNPYKDLARAERRQRRILGAMFERGAITERAYHRALEEPLRLLPRRGEVRAPHLTAKIAGALEAEVAAGAARPGVIETTLDLQLQERISAVLKRQQADLAAHGRFQAAAVVLDTRTSEVLAWVGSRAYRDAEQLGANDGVAALRQPGSALKPFVYGAWLEAGGSAGQILVDEPLEVRTPSGIYRPENYDRRYHGRVSVREALGSSLNIPAVKVAVELGTARLLRTLRRAGLESLDQPAAHYGPGLALGNGEVRLIDLAGAYAALGRLGLWRAPRWVEGQTVAPPRRLFARETAFTLLEMLSDDRARGIGFGLAGPLSLPFRLAAKTGTSSDYRDNWAVGVTPDYTVAVWVGRFDGRPMNRVSGSVGAAPTLRQIVQILYPSAASPGDVPWPRAPRGVTLTRLCKRSGALDDGACGATFDEWLTPAAVAQAASGRGERPLTRGDRLPSLVQRRASVEPEGAEVMRGTLTSAR